MTGTPNATEMYKLGGEYDRGDGKTIALNAGIPPLVEITQTVKDLIDSWIEMAPGEISGLGTIKEEQRGGRLHIVVENLWLIEQTCSAGSTNMSFKEIAQFLMKGKPEGIKDEDIRFWFHSHADFNTFWSGTDHATHTQLVGGGSNWLNIVGNKAGSMLAKYVMRDPVSISYDGLPIEIIGKDEGVLKRAIDEFQGKITNLPADFEVTVDRGRLVIPAWKPEVVTPFQADESDQGGDEVAEDKESSSEPVEEQV